MFISSWYPTRHDPTHGIFNTQFARAATLHHKVSVLHVSSDKYVQAGMEQEILREPVFTLLMYYRKITSTSLFPGRLLKYRRAWKAYQKGFSLIVRERGMPALIHVNVALPAGIFARRLSKKYGIPIVLNEGWTGYCPEDGRYSGFLPKLYTRKIVAHAKVIMPVSAYLEDVMRSHGLKGDYEIVPNVVDTDIFTPGEKRTDSNSFLHVSALDDEQKNVSGILRAFAAACRSNADLSLTIIGEGAAKKHLMHIAAELGVSSRVRFMGKQPARIIAAELRAARALVIFSRYETFCVAAAEALSCGIPIISSDNGGVSSYFRDYMGVLVPSDNEEALTKAMIQPMPAFDPVKSREFIVTAFSPQAVAERLRSVYSRVLGGPATLG